MFKRFSDVFYMIRQNHNNDHRHHNTFCRNDNRDHRNTFYHGHNTFCRNHNVFYHDHNTFCRNHNASYHGRNTFCNTFFSKCNTLLYIFYNNPIKFLLLFDSKLIYEV